MLMIYNHKKVMKSRFGTERMVEESKILTKQFDINVPTFIDSYILRGRLDD
jgi:hypothetical protein